MTAGEYCNRDVVVIGPDATVIEAAKLMRHYHVGTLVVVDQTGFGALPLGILTDRDLVIEVVAQEVPLDSVLVKDVMSAALVTVREKASLLDSLEIMRSHGVRRLPVVNETGFLQGILSVDDAIELISEASHDLAGIVRHEMTREEQIHS